MQIILLNVLTFFLCIIYEYPKSGRSGKTIPELEKTIGLMKRVVERVQKENEDLKKAPGVVTNEKLSNLELENERLKVSAFFLVALVSCVCQSVVQIQ